MRCTHPVGNDAMITSNDRARTVTDRKTTHGDETNPLFTLLKPAIHGPTFTADAVNVCCQCWSVCSGLKRHCTKLMHCSYCQANKSVTATQSELALSDETVHCWVRKLEVAF